MRRQDRDPVPESLSRLLASLALASLLWAVPLHAAERVGVVLMHGEQGAPGRAIDGLAGALEKQGYLVARPDMCWSARRGYESAFGDCLNAVDDAIIRMRNLGATRFVVGGLGLGGNAAIAYGASRPGLTGVLALAPGHDAHEMAGEAEIADSIAGAKALIAQGKGDKDASFADIGIGPAGPYVTEIRTTPAIYMSFFGEASPTVIADNAGRLAVPLLWVANSPDPAQSGPAPAAFEAAPANPLNRYVVVASPYLGTAEAAKGAVANWLQGLSHQ